MKLSVILFSVLFASVRAGHGPNYPEESEECLPWYLKYWKGTYMTGSELPWEFSPVNVGSQVYTPDVGGSVQFLLSDHTSLVWKNSGRSINRVFVEYYDAQTGYKTCTTQANYDIFDEQFEFFAGCMKNAPVTPITITVIDDSFDDSDDPKPPACCGGISDFDIDPEWNVVEYVVVLRCEPDYCDNLEEEE
jgi:hypothetical protein